MVKVSQIDLTAISDPRGLLAAVQYPQQLPFAPERVFIVTDSSAGTERGGHAHRTCHQVLIAVAGVVVIEYDDENGTSWVTLSAATECIHIPPLAWAKQTYLTDGASLLVLASHPFDAADYIDDRDTARSLRAASA